MYPPLTLASKYVKYYLTAANGRGHGIHSPFTYAFVREVLMNRKDYYAYRDVELYRERLRNDDTVLEIQDFGAGSRISKTKTRSVSSIVKSAAKSPKLAQLIFRIADYQRATHMLELGTSLGITTSYLAAARPEAEITTIEGDPSIASIAGRHFRESGYHHIRQLIGHFDDLLPKVLPPQHPYDLVYIDGNHRYEPTIRYFRALLPHMAGSSVMIFDDIHWSSEMEQAWDEVCNDPSVMLTIDLFFVGLVFFRDSFKVRQNFAIRF